MPVGYSYNGAGPECPASLLLQLFVMGLDLMFGVGADTQPGATYPEPMLRVIALSHPVKYPILHSTMQFPADSASELRCYCSPSLESAAASREAPLAGLRHPRAPGDGVLRGAELFICMH